MAFKRLANFEHEQRRRFKVSSNRSYFQHASQGLDNEEDIMKQHPRKWFLPIFVVQNTNKPEKIRIVWEATATYYGVSLN